MAIRFPGNTAAKRQKALAEAEREFARSDKKRGKQKYVNLRTDQIKERLELFQPREFSYGARSVDPDRVKELAGRISIQGELEPVWSSVSARNGSALAGITASLRIAMGQGVGTYKQTADMPFGPII